MSLVIIRESQTTMSVGKDNWFYNGLDATNLSANIHAIQWDGSEGHVEVLDDGLESIVSVNPIDGVSDYDFAVTKWQEAFDAELAAKKQAAYDVAHREAIADGSSEEEAVAAGNAARDAVTSL